MLKSLLISDYALIENIEVEFHQGLNIITGETGAGKSIIIGALGLLLGERASTEVVRDGAQKSIVEGIFDVAKNGFVSSILKENEIEESDELIIRREISLKGTNRCFANDSPVSLQLIKEIGNRLVDLHGQHEHQSLLRTEMHIEMLDEAGNYASEIEKFNHQVSQLKKFNSELADLKKRENLLREKREIYNFQLKEISSINPLVGEDDELLSELKIMENAEKLASLSLGAYSALYDGEEPAYDKLAHVRNLLTELAEIDSALTEKISEIDTAMSLVSDISDTLRNYSDKISHDPLKLESIRDRLGAINLLNKKFGGSLEKVLEYKAFLISELEIADNFSGSINKLETAIEGARRICGETAVSISEKRFALVPSIKKGIENSLKFLGIENAVFDIKITQNAASSSDSFIYQEDNKVKFDNRGIDIVEFFISTNLGESPKPLIKVASGGEVSRIMLSIKSILAKNDKLPLLIFDEIDTGVSGRIAQKVGYSLKQLSSLHQIIAITHLPQIAALADHHFIVEKLDQKDRVKSVIRELSGDERLREVAKLLSGEEVTGASLNSAKELMGAE